METIRHIEAFRSALDWRRSKRTVGFVSTMGSLHDGHRVVIEACKAEADITVVSTYVNPLRFSDDESFFSYPRSHDKDAALLEELSVDFLFQPRDEEMFPTGTTECVSVHLPRPENSFIDSRTYDASATVWLKLLHIVEPDLVVVGEKDYVELVGFKKLVEELAVNTQINTVPIARDQDGVALSDSLRTLTAEQRKHAPVLHQTLRDLAIAIKDGAKSYAKLEQTARIALKGAGFSTSYIAIRESRTLAIPEKDTQNLRIIGAAQLGAVEMIDNIAVDL